MALQQLRIAVAPDHADILEELLLAQNALSVSFEDGADEPVFEPIRGTTPLWSDTRVVALFEADAPMSTILERIGKAFHSITETPLEPGEITTVADRDWERVWMDEFHPTQFGRRLWVVPSWQAPPDPDAVNLILDPGLAFGSGTHPTTALCLTWLDSQALDGKVVLDYGCGSGILGLAALALGAKRVVAVDNDPQALEATRDNLVRNGFDPDRIETCLPHQVPDLQADVTVANILAQPLIELADVIVGLTRPGGIIALSGILENQAEAVAARYAQLGTLNEPTLSGDWVRLDGIVHS